MTESEILLVVADLLIAMQNENLEETKKLVDFLNKNFTAIDNVKNLNELVPVYKLYSDNENHQSYIYVINNLNGLIGIEQLKWNLQINALITKNNKQEIEEFLLSMIPSLSSLDEYKINSLIRLSIKINNYDILNTIRQYLKRSE